MDSAQQHFTPTASSMNNFDSANRPFKEYVNGRVRAIELSRALAEFELKTDFQATESDIRKIEIDRRFGRVAGIEQSSGQPPSLYEVIPDDLRKAYGQLTKRANFWMRSLYNNSTDWALFSDTGAKLFQRPVAARGFRSVAVNVSDVIGWLDTTNQSELAMALTSKRDVTTRHLLRLAGPAAQEQPKDSKKAIAWPWGRHNTYLLEVLAATAEKWWEGFTPLDDTTHLKKEFVVNWIVKEHFPHVSVHVASMIYTILRADDLPKGRPRKY